MIPKTRNIPWIAQDRIVAYILDVLTLYAASRSARGLEMGSFLVSAVTVA